MKTSLPGVTSTSNSSTSKDKTILILEGPDGSGKTTLLDNLLTVVNGVEQHERAATSTGGPVDDIYEWAEEDVITWRKQPFSVYDRHPFISELVYGPTVRNHLDPRFVTSRGISVREEFYDRALIVICLPDKEIARGNLNNHDQMSGVVENFDSLWHQYNNLRITLSRANRRVFWYDYTRKHDFSKLAIVAQGHQIMWNKKAGNH